MKNIKLFFMAFFMIGMISACSDNTGNTSEETADTVNEETQPVAATEDGTYEIDTDASEIEWVGKKVTGQHNGTVDVKDGSFEVQGNAVTQGRLIIDMTTIENEDLKDDEESRGKLEGHLKSEDFFNVEQYPEATFVLKNISKQEGDTYNVTGDLTMKDVTSEVSFPATVSTEGDELTAEGELTFDRTKWNIKYGSGQFFEGLGDKMIYDEVTIKFDLQASK